MDNIHKSVASPGGLLVKCFVMLMILNGSLCQLLNRAPHFIPTIGDMSKFSLKENTPVGTPVYQLKGNFSN